MNTDQRLQYLIKAALQAGITVRQEWLGGDGGGLCQLRGERVLFVDRAADLKTQYDVTLEAVAELGELDRETLPPEVLEDLQQHRSS